MRLCINANLEWQSLSALYYIQCLLWITLLRTEWQTPDYCCPLRLQKVSGLAASALRYFCKPCSGPTQTTRNRLDFLRTFWIIFSNWSYITRKITCIFLFREGPNFHFSIFARIISNTKVKIKTLSEPPSPECTPSLDIYIGYGLSLTTVTILDLWWKKTANFCSSSSTSEVL